MINFFLSLLGIDGPNWLGDPDWTLPAFVMMSLWAVGGTVVIFIAALQGVPVELYEAAELDGAADWRRFVNITLPLISPVILFALITGVIATFQTFAVSYIMTGGGPANASLFYLLYLYRNAFSWFEMGYASALAWFLFLIIMICTGILLRNLRHVGALRRHGEKSDGKHNIHADPHTQAHLAAASSKHVAVYGLLFVLGALFLLPFLWMVTSSLRSQGAGITFPPQFLPTEFQLAELSARVRDDPVCALLP